MVGVVWLIVLISAIREEVSGVRSGQDISTKAIQLWSAVQAFWLQTSSTSSAWHVARIPFRHIKVAAA
jgi:hypothetical protein